VKPEHGTGVRPPSLVVEPFLRLLGGFIKPLRSLIVESASMSTFVSVAADFGV